MQRRLKQLAAVLAHPPIVKDAVALSLRGRFGDARRCAVNALRRPNFGAEKIVSRKYRYLWLCNPKVASRSLIAALRSADPDAELIEDKSIAEVGAMYPEARGYYSFAFIRHPFDRALSLYAEMRFFRKRFDGVNRLRKEERQRFYDDHFYGLGEVDSFDDYCRWLNTPYGADAFADAHYLSQRPQILLEGGRLPDFVGRLENIHEDLERVALRLGMPAPELPMLNTMAGWRPSSEAVRAARAEMGCLLTERNRALLTARYAADLELYRSVSEGSAETGSLGVDAGEGLPSTGVGLLHGP